MTQFCGAARRRTAGSILIGLAGVALLSLPAAGGDPITFSAPKQEAETPARKSILDGLPKPGLKWDLRGPEREVAPPLSLPLDPLTQKKLREQRTEPKNWLLNEPALFRDRFPDPFQKNQAPSEEGLSPWERDANRLFGRPGQTEKTKQDGSRPAPPALSAELLGDADGKTGERTGFPGLGGPESGEGPRAQAARDNREKRQNSPEEAMKTLFGPKDATDRAPLLPGLSLSDSIDQAEAKVLKREQQEKREEFQRLLAPPGQAPAGGLLDPINTLPDLTRTPAYPVAPTVSLPAVRNPTELPGLPNLESRMPRVGPGPDDGLGRPQAAASRGGPDNKTRQLESLNLMSRPSVLTLPGRPF